MATNDQRRELTLLGDSSDSMCARAVIVRSDWFEPTDWVVLLGGKPYLLGWTGAVIGAAEDCQIRVLGDQRVASRHADLQPNGRRDVLLRALDSRFEVRVDGQPVDELRLRGGEKIAIGSLRLSLDRAGAHVPQR